MVFPKAEDRKTLETKKLIKIVVLGKPYTKYFYLVDVKVLCCYGTTRRRDNATLYFVNDNIFGGPLKK